LTINAKVRLDAIRSDPDTKVAQRVFNAVVYRVEPNQFKLPETPAK